MYNINRRKFLGLFGCGCCSLLLPSCSTVPITDRKQLTLIPEAKINSQAAAAYEQFRSKTKIINSGSQLEEVKNIGKRIEKSVSAYFNKKGEIDHLTKLIRPNLGLITNISYAHIKNFDILDNIAKAKAEIYSGLQSSGTAIINADDAYADPLGPPNSPPTTALLTPRITKATKEHATNTTTE